MDKSELSQNLRKKRLEVGWTIRLVYNCSYLELVDRLHITIKGIIIIDFKEFYEEDS